MGVLKVPGDTLKLNSIKRMWKHDVGMPGEVHVDFSDAGSYSDRLRDIRQKQNNDFMKTQLERMELERFGGVPGPASPVGVGSQGGISLEMEDFNIQVNPASTISDIHNLDPGLGDPTSPTSPTRRYKTWNEHEEVMHLN